MSSAACSITSTQRRRFFWAAWWTGTPSYTPFRKPDASNGGAASVEEALADAERAAQRHLTIIEPHFARAWKQVLRGQTPIPPQPKKPKPTPSRPTGPISHWSVLGLEPNASLAAVKVAYRKRALSTHPDQGGDSDDFRAVHRAYEKLTEKLQKKPRARSTST